MNVERGWWAGTVTRSRRVYRVCRGIADRRGPGAEESMVDMPDGTWRN